MVSEFEIMGSVRSRVHVIGFVSVLIRCHFFSLFNLFSENNPTQSKARCVAFTYERNHTESDLIYRINTVSHFVNPRLNICINV